MSSISRGLGLSAIAGIPEVRAGDDLAAILIRALNASAYVTAPGDVLVIAQKIVSKAEGRVVDLRCVTPSSHACELALITCKDPRLVEVILSEASGIVRAAPHVLIVRHRLGFVMANAGVDRSNVPCEGHGEPVLLLPRDCDGAAAELHGRLTEHFGGPIGVIISDSFGRPWRKGVVNVALGAAGLPALIDRRGERDRNGRALEVTEVALADAIAGAAALLMGEGAEGTPVVLARGLRWQARDNAARTLVRPVAEDLFQ
jgi:coenzyme F420-0:L-glutamate ligase/coenzyme F420-1:gamma-L-glutamate ligase